MGKTIQIEELVEIPEGVTVTIKAGLITVKGPLATISKKLPKAQVLYRNVENDKKKKCVKITMFLANRKRQSCVVSLSKFIKNLIKGVTVGFEYRLRYGFNILPARPLATDKGKSFEISNYMGQKDTHYMKCPPGVEVRNHEDPKSKELFVRGHDLELVGRMGKLVVTSVDNLPEVSAQKP